MPEPPTYTKRAHPATMKPSPAPARSCKQKKLRYAELSCRSNFSFLRGASHPEELAERAAELGYQAIALTDRNTLAGVVRMHCAAKACHIKLIVGAEITPINAPPILLYATDRASYGRLCRIITQGRLREQKGSCAITIEDIAQWSKGLIAAVPLSYGRDSDVWYRRLAGGDFTGPIACAPGSDMVPTIPDSLVPSFPRSLDPLTPPPLHLFAPSSIPPYQDIFGDALYLAVSVHGGPDDQRHLLQMHHLSQRTGVPMVAINDVHYHEPQRRFLQDILTCIRHRCTIAEAGTSLFANAERYLKPIEKMQRLFAEYPGVIERTVDIADRCTFTLDELRYEYPEALCPPGREPTEYLAELSWAGAHERYPDGVPDKVRRLIEHELTLIHELDYERYFLTVWDIVRFARSRDILCQGRGSAANSAVCYCIGITSVDPDRADLLFERFVSAERNEPPDIDVDFEHERREEVFQYIYGKYGREHAAIVAEVITYRPRSAIRDVGKALGLSLDRVTALAKLHEWWDAEALPEQTVREAGFDPADRTLRMLAKLVRQLIGFPRHLSQHVGGFVITRGPLCELVPIENGAMPDRTFIEWDKDDIDALGMLKIDCLSLGMLTAIRKCMKMLEGYWGEGAEGGRGGGAKRRSFIATTKRRRKDHGDSQNISRFDRLAKGDDPCDRNLSVHRRSAEHREIRIDRADEKSRSVDPIQHRRGAWAGNEEGLSSFSIHSPRITDGATDAAHFGRTTEPCSGFSTFEGSAGGNGSHTTRPSPKPQTPKQLASSPPPPLRTSEPFPLPPSAPPNLRTFVPSSLHHIPPEDPFVYNMICRADTVGVFQIESRAQMSMLPRLKPRCFYDLVIEVAIVRPGPIQGGMVHPYLRRRSGQEPVTYPNDAIRQVLERTLGVPLFQEQAMRLAIVAADFTPGEADQLRRAMGAWRRHGDINRFRTKLIEGMKRNGLPEEFAERCFKQICGFGEYGFPESHAASFALLVYVSAWLKRYHPAAFCAAILNSLPMGFYHPAQLVRDAREHGVSVLPIDVNYSGYDCRLEGGKGLREQGNEGLRGQGNEETGEQNPSPERKRRVKQSRDRKGVDRKRPGNVSTNTRSDAAPSIWGVGGPTLRLGMRLIKGISTTMVEGIQRAQRERPFTSIADLAHRSGAAPSTLARLAAADAMRSLGLDRRQAVWNVLSIGQEPPMLQGTEPNEPTPELPKMSTTDTVFADYETIGLSLNAHPISLIRPELSRAAVVQNKTLQHAQHGKWVRVAGLVVVRQRPATASGITFCTLEDETGTANLVIKPNVWERFRIPARRSIAQIAEGRVERIGEVVHVNVARIESLSHYMTNLKTKSRNFR